MGLMLWSCRLSRHWDGWHHDGVLVWVLTTLLRYHSLLMRAEMQKMVGQVLGSLPSCERARWSSKLLDFLLGPILLWAFEEWTTRWEIFSLSNKPDESWRQAHQDFFVKGIKWKSRENIFSICLSSWPPLGWSLFLCSWRLACCSWIIFWRPVTILAFCSYSPISVPGSWEQRFQVTQLTSHRETPGEEQE